MSQLQQNSFQLGKIGMTIWETMLVFLKNNSREV